MKKSSEGRWKEYNLKRLNEQKAHNEDIDDLFPSYDISGNTALLQLTTPEIYLIGHSLTQVPHSHINASHQSILPVTVSFSGLSQSRMTNEGHPSTVTTVRLVGGFCGGLVAFPSVASSLGNRLTESVMEQGLFSGFWMYRTWGPKRERTLRFSLVWACTEGGGKLKSIYLYEDIRSHIINR